MLDIFLNQPSTIHYPLKYWSKWDYIKRMTLRELQRITNYYSRRSRFVNNSHLLSNLVKILRPELDLSIVDYFRHVDNVGENISRRFDFVSTSWKGEIREDIFSQNEKVVFLYTNKDIDIFSFPTNWRYMIPIRVLYTNEYRLDYYQYDETREYTTPNILVLEVDINTLLLMYKYWGLERLKNDESINPNYFIAQVVQPKLAIASVDIILFNKFINTFYSVPMESYITYEHPIHLVDTNSYIHGIYRDICRVIKSTKLPLEQLLMTIPTIYNKNMLDVLFINMPYYTRQSEWILWLSRLRYVVFLLDILEEPGIRRNLDTFNKLPVLIKMLRNRSTDLESKVGTTIYNELNGYITRIEDWLGKR